MGTISSDQRAAQTPAKTGWQKFASRHRDALIASVLLGPMIFWWLVVSGFPTLFGFFLGFFEWIGINDHPEFIWFRNFIQFFNDPLYYESLWRSIWLGTLVTVADAGVRSPIRKDIAETDAYKSAHPEMYSVFKAMEGNVQGLPTFAKDNSKVWEVFGDVVAKLLATNGDIKQIMDKAQQDALKITQ